MCLLLKKNRCKENRLRDTKNIFEELCIEELATKKEISFAKALWQKLSAIIYKFT